MLTYKAMYKFFEQGVHAEVLDFPGTIRFGGPMSRPDRSRTEPEVDLEEPIYLLLTAASRISLGPRNPSYGAA